MSVELKGITKCFGSQKAVNNLSLSLKEGEITGFLGPNGAGKTTTMKMIAGLLCPDSGSIEIMGKDIAQYGLEARKLIGYLPENNPLYLDMYVKEYLTYIAHIYLNKNECASSVENVINITGLNKEKHKKISQLSKGYKQRVGIAQALIHDPKILILDEATTGLDPNQIIEIRNLIKNVGKDKILLLSTHIMQEVEAICDRIVIIKDGEVITDEKKNSISHISESYNIVVEFNRDINCDSLMNIEGFISCEKHDSQILVKAKQDIREDIFSFAVENGFTIKELHLVEEDLESIFTNLTK